MSRFSVLDLFSGIGGFSLGLERTGGFKTAAFCEIEEYPRKVLAKHWPGVPIYEDVRELSADRLRADGITIDVITGGFPCQDISTAGKGAGITGERSGLWKEIARLAGELRPQYILLENVAALLGRGLGTVLGDLAEIGYDCEWHCIPASAIGAPHRRDRVWCVGYPSQHISNGSEAISSPSQSVRPVRESRGTNKHVVFQPGGNQRRLVETDSEWTSESEQGRISGGAPSKEQADAHPVSQRFEGRLYQQIIDTQRRQIEALRWSAQCDTGWQRDGRGTWEVEPSVGRVAHGIPKRVDRLKGLGNAVVPQIPELIGRAILDTGWHNNRPGQEK